MVKHAAAIAAELLDNDEDGIVDDTKVAASLKERHAAVVIFKSETASENFADSVDHNELRYAELYYDEVNPSNPGQFMKDASFEEILHAINCEGHAKVYPEAFNMRDDGPVSLLMEAMDVARAGHFENVPDTYPDAAWYHYNDRSCHYDCQCTEYLYWGIGSMIGIFEAEEPDCERLADEWELCSPVKFKEGDELLFTLITDPKYKIPTKRPDGNYWPNAVSTTTKPDDQTTSPETTTRPDSSTRPPTESTTTRPTDENHVIFEVTETPYTDELYKYMKKYINVLDCFEIFAQNNIDDKLVKHAAAVAAEILDNDEDGEVDDLLLKQKLEQNKGMIAIFKAEGNQAMKWWRKHYEGKAGAVLFEGEIDPDYTGFFGRDATFEEILHNVNGMGHIEIYPEAFGIPGITGDDDQTPQEKSKLLEAMDVARGGYFENVPDTYPEEAWYHYDDKTCEYECMAIEYLYWGIGSMIGMFESVEENNCEQLSNEWELCSPRKFKEGDIALYGLLSNPQFKMPQRRPDGNYWPNNPVSTTTLPDLSTTIRPTITTTAPSNCDDVDVSWSKGAKWGLVQYQSPHAVFLRYKVQNQKANRPVIDIRKNNYIGFLVCYY